MGNQQGMPTRDGNKSNSSNNSSNDDVSKRNQLQKRHTVVVPSITTTAADDSKINAKPRRASEGGNPMMRIPESRGGKQPSPVPELDERMGASPKMSPSLQRINVILGRGRRHSEELSPGSSPPATSNPQYLTAAAATDDSTQSVQHHNHNSRRLSVELAVKDALKDAAHALTKSPLLSRKLFKGHADMNFFQGRRSRRGSETDQGPLFDVKPSGPPVVPHDEIFNPGQDLANDLAVQPPRMRARTIGNGHATGQKLEGSAAAAAAAAVAARKRRSGTKSQIPTVFRYPGDGISGADTKVYVFGTMSNWKCLEMARPKGETDFIRVIDCMEGKSYYRFNVDGTFKHDPRQEYKQHENGKAWNHITVERSDSDVFEALACDSFSLRDSRYDSGKVNDSDRLEDNDWTQEKPTQAFINSPKHKGPPLLPPHLLQVLLNKEFPAMNDPVLLPEPSHVTLDHLYAQSIRDNMLVLSTTTRYRKKCVTMVLYRPI